MLLPLLAFVAAASAAGLFIRSRNVKSRALIESELKAHRATDIAIASDWFDFDRGTLTYDVTYTDASGRRARNRAKVAVGRLADRHVYWRDPLSS